MKILWVSCRVIGNDLCGTTQIALANGLAARGHDITFVSPGEKPIDSLFHHNQIKEGRIKGFKSKSIALSFKKSTEIEADIRLVDWRLVPFLKKWLENSSTPWYLVDRSPPADSGIFSKIQFWYWKRAWSLSKNGMAVSSAHSEFILKNTKTTANIDVIGGGVEPSKFKQSEFRKGKVKFIYIGKIDSNRDVNNLPEIILKLGGKLCVVGKGDISRKMKIKWEHNPDIEILDSISNDLIPSLLHDSDVGLLPMPNQKIWRLASPLKLAEYAAAGLLVAGIDHQGNRLEFNPKWLFLADSMDAAIESTLTHISDIKLRKSARDDAINYLKWDKWVDKLELSLKSLTCIK
jgi:glycosyltransferase involved in cell wall biosynthesis